MKNRYLKNVVTLKLHPEKCTGCGMCIQVCPHHVFELIDRKVEILDRDLCMECGACANNCPFSALEVRSGVGCAAALIEGALTGGEPNCGGSGCEGGCC